MKSIMHTLAMAGKFDFEHGALLSTLFLIGSITTAATFCYYGNVLALPLAVVAPIPGLISWSAEYGGLQKWRSPHRSDHGVRTAAVYRDAVCPHCGKSMSQSAKQERS